MNQTATTTLPKIVRLTLPPKARLRPGSPFFNNMKAELVGPHPTKPTHMIVLVGGSELHWLKECVHEALKDD